MSIVKSFSVGDGDMFYIKHFSENFSVIDCCYDDKDRFMNNIREIIRESKGKNIFRFISTHPDIDHIKGLCLLDDNVNISNFYCVKNEAIKEDESDDFNRYCELRENTKKAFYLFKGCKRRWMNKSGKGYHPSGLDILWPNVNNLDYIKALNDVKEGKNYNDLSIIMTYSIKNGPKYMWMGDMETGFQEKIKDKVDWGKVDILFAPHHGRKSGHIPSDILKKIDPKIIVIGEGKSEELDYYKKYNTIKQNTAGDIIFDYEDKYIHIFVEDETYVNTIDTLVQKDSIYKRGYYYIGSLEV